MTLGTPHHRLVRDEPFGVFGNKRSDFATLAEKVTHQLAGQVDHSETTVVKSRIQDVVLNPEIMGACAGNLEPGHFDGIIKIGKVHDVHVTAGNGRALNVETRRKNLVTHDHIELPGGLASEWKRGMCASERVGVLRELNGVARTPPCDAVPNIDQHDSVLPVRRICDPVFNPDVVDGMAWSVEFKSTDTERQAWLGNVDDVVTSARTEGV